MDLALLTHPVLLVINALAVARLAILITRDSFPFGILRARVRDYLNDRMPWTTKPSEMTDADRRAMNAYDGEHPVAYLVTCPWCVSMYLAPAVAVLAATGTWWLWISVPLAFSAVAGWVATITD